MAKAPVRSSSSWTIEFVGTGSLVSQMFRGLPAAIVEIAGMRALIDCGDGTLGRLRASGHASVDCLLLTSIGTSTVGGALTLAEGQRRSSRRPLRIFVPPGTRPLVRTLFEPSEIPTDELVDVIEIEPGAPFLSHRGVHFEAVSLPGRSKLPYLAYALAEEPLPGRVDVEAAARLGIRGAEFSLLLQGETVRGVQPSDVIGPMRHGRRLLYAGRGRESPALLQALTDCDLAVFATPYMDERLELAQDTGYLTGWEAAKYSREANVQLLCLQQLGPFAPVRYQVAEASQFHDNTHAPNDGDVITIPLVDNGAPRFERPHKGNRAGR